MLCDVANLKLACRDHISMQCFSVLSFLKASASKTGLCKLMVEVMMVM